MWHQKDHRKDICFQYQTRRQRVTLLDLSGEEQTIQVSQGHVCECPQMPIYASTHFALQIDFSKYINSQTDDLQITRIN